MPTLLTAKRIEMWPLERLRPYERNARTHSPEQVAQIVASIQEFGFTNPLLVDGADGILAGHGRLAAAKDMGLAEVPVIVLDHLSAAQRRAYILADNQLALNAGWDTELLQMEVAALNLEDFNLSLLGFSDDELAGLWGNDENTEVGDVEDSPPTDQGIALAIVLTPQELMQWRRAKAELGYSTDKSAFWKMVENLLEEVE
jgi:ParB-like chromosome segregation protein Spo0J